MGLENNGGFRVDAFNDPVEALSKFKAGKYDLLLLVFFLFNGGGNGTILSHNTPGIHTKNQRM
jgi:hypothetical protein